jgi:hypothetical protein
MAGKNRLGSIHDLESEAAEIWLPNKDTTQRTVSFAAPSFVREETLGGNKVVNYSDGQSGWSWSSTSEAENKLPQATASILVLRVLPALMLAAQDPTRSLKRLGPGALDFSYCDNENIRLTIDENTHLLQRIT